MSPLNMSAINKEGMFTKETLCIWFFSVWKTKGIRLKAFFQISENLRAPSQCLL